jgi:hypothetical protein
MMDRMRLRQQIRGIELTPNPDQERGLDFALIELRLGLTCNSSIAQANRSGTVMASRISRSSHMSPTYANNRDQNE